MQTKHHPQPNPLPAYIQQGGDRTFAYRIFLRLQIFSIHKLFQGTTISGIENKEFNYHDASSIYLLQRALIENYLTFHYLNIDNISEDQAMYRFHLYEMSGLQRRQIFPAKELEHKSKQQKEKIEIEELEKLIQKNKYFNTLSSSDKKYIIKNIPSKEKSWEYLLKEGPLHEMFLYTWKLYSNYAHSEMIEAIQLKEYFNNNEAFDESLFFALQQVNILSSVLVTDLLSFDPIINSEYDKIDNNIKLSVRFWNELGRKKIRI